MPSDLLHALDGLPRQRAHPRRRDRREPRIHTEGGQGDPSRERELRGDEEHDAGAGLRQQDAGERGTDEDADAFDHAAGHIGRGELVRCTREGCSKRPFARA